MNGMLRSIHKKKGLLSSSNCTCTIELFQYVVVDHVYYMWY